jgi:zinc transport system substrate-binding protein
LKRSFFAVILISLLILAVLSGFAEASQKVPVVVSIPPQKYFLEQIGKELVDVTVLIEPGADPHVFEPRPAQMVKLAKSRAYFAIGLTFENAILPRIRDLNPDMEFYDLSEGVFRYPMEAGHSEDDDHHNEGHHHGEDSETGLHKDPHIWNSPRNVSRIARNIAAALYELDPETGQKYRENCFAFLLELDKLDSELRTVFLGKEGSRFLVFHPAWGYFARDYGLVQVPVEIEGKEPKPADMAELINIARREKIKTVFTSPQFSERSSKILAKEIGASVIRIDPLAESWLENMEKVGSAIGKAVTASNDL